MPADQIKLVSGARAIAFAGDDLLDIAKERAPDPAVFDERDPFFWRAEVSNSNLDFYFTRMNEVTLTNFSEDSTAGVSFQDSHDYRKLGFGRSLRGQYIPAGAGEMTEDGYPLNRTHTDFATLRGLTLNGVNTTDFIDGVRSGILSDVSVGFWATDIRCSICGGEMIQFWGMLWGMDCDHIPGMQYQVTNEAGEPLIDPNGNPIKKTAFAWIMDGRLSEVSIVYDGATPNAAVLKAELMAKAGKLKDGERSMLERRYRMVLPDPTKRIAVPDTALWTPQGGTAMPAARTKPMKRDAEETPAVEPEVTATEPEITDEVSTIDDDFEPEAGEGTDAAPSVEAAEGERSLANSAEYAALRTRLKDEGITLGKNPLEAIRFLGDTVIRYRREASDGRQYRKDLESQAETSLIRAYGREVNLEMYRSVFKRSSVAELKTLIADFDKQGDARFPGGRVTSDNNVIDINSRKPDENDDPRSYTAP